jgi:hypothetical protein
MPYHSHIVSRIYNLSYIYIYVPRLYSCKKAIQYDALIQYVVVVAVAVAAAAVGVGVVVLVVVVGVVVVVVVVVPNISMSQCPSQLFTWHGVTAAEIHQVGCTTNGGSFH